MHGHAVLNDATLNKGTAFTGTEREALGIDGLLPPRIETITEQCARIRDKYERLHDDLERHIFLRALQDTNQVLFYAFVEEHIAEMLPVLYTPTVGLACQEFSHIYRRPHGLFLSYPDRDRMADQLGSVDSDVDVVVVTDGERILGLGDQGLGGMGIPIGKLSLYGAAGGLDPARLLPVMLDVGTNNDDLLRDPLYLGWRHERIVGADYDDFVDQFVTMLSARFPGVLLQWEDFAGQHATPLLHRYRDRLLSFNDDIQGTAAVALATVHAAVKAKGSTLADQRFCIVGAGSAGSGIAAMLRDALAQDGVTDPTARLHLTDADGLLHDHRSDLADFQVPFRQPWEAVAGWAVADGPTELATVVDHARPTVLIGVSGQPGLFTEPIVRSMLGATDRPIILPLSNPTSRAEATPADVLRWTDGRALIATGSPFDDVVHEGVTHRISQANNVYVFPGIGLGALVANASKITDGMLLAAARGVADDTPDTSSDATMGVLPPLDQVQTVSRRIAGAVAAAAASEGVGDQIDDEEIRRRIDERWWSPAYARIEPER
ncbi:MAG: NAD-dependent malic enzyme [Acidimicrobiia bacterium]|nr:NAD-dependent malic enzyme [Acidimicrobiia bacterium]